MKYLIEFNSRLLNKRITKVVENPKDYAGAIILKVIKEEPKFDLVEEIEKMLHQQVKVAKLLAGGVIYENN